MSSIAVEGQASLQRPQTVQRVRSITMPASLSVSAPSVHALIQLRQPMHRVFIHCSSCVLVSDSGFWHQMQERLHPLKNTVERMPGPSSVDMR
jgi:hypothetical protein